ncbi:alkaline phosphatase family protein [Thermoflavimicrobium dichotomicum]|uniref:Metalloenzyme superfamily protein n=1 Tax=Thermoflavimicrobium dichotomicum TaxID=46223 RepID=A0A1I3JK27_9BACL|nr:alkaline phosphatase family protein [Thermoflavimicrobium dichotomicum]SFI60629.1 Metalloenzyme superfamily protein [Thermoflavimicrobium dichotomicum]
MAVILLFIDGVGLGDEAEYNPWFTHATPHLRQLLSGHSLTRRAVGQHGEEILLLETDAKLGVPGIPQSATGQATIFTGRNAPLAMGAHMSGFPFKRLREWVERDNIYLQFEKKGWKATFANSYTKEYFERPATKRGWVSVSTAAIRSSKEPIRMLPDLLAGRAVYHDLTRRTLKRFLPDIAEISPEQAATDLWRIAQEAHLVIHEFFLSDYAGHKQDLKLISWVVETYDRFLGELVRLKKKEDVIVLTSDHGNSEDLRAKTHTENSVPTLIIGKRDGMANCELENWDLTNIAPLLHQLVQHQMNQKD